MPMTKEEVEKIIEAKREKLNNYLLNQDAAGLITLYHPEAVLLHGGEDKPIVGREAIQKAYEIILTVKPDFDDRCVYKSFTEDGKYLVSHGEFTVKGFSGVIEYQHVYQQQPDGDYLIYYQRRGELKA